MEAYDEVVSLLPAKYRGYFEITPKALRPLVAEFRLRADRKLTIHTVESAMPILESGAGWTVRQNDILEILAHLGAYSLNRNEHTLYKGYLTIKSGHRVGVCGTYLPEGHIDLESISSINIRIAREHPGSAFQLLNTVAADGGFRSLLIAGPPLSGKTTLLRDLGRSLSDRPYCRKVVMIDERAELAGVCDGTPTRTVGLCCDVLSGYPRDLGFEVALRNMSPDIILCDEIGDADYAILQDAAKSGVGLIATAHAQSKEDLMARKIIKRCLDEGIFQSVVLIDRVPNIGQIKDRIQVKG